MQVDEQGLKLTTDSTEAVEHFNAAMTQYLEYRAGVMAPLKKCLEADPEFVMGQCLMGYLMLLFGSITVHGRVKQNLEAADAGAKNVTARERGHIEALRAWLDGDLNKSNGIWDAILVEYPTDLLALRLAHFNIFWMGLNQLLRDGVARVFRSWDESIPGYSMVLGMYAFGLEECGEYERAEAMGRKAAELNPDDLWAIHAVAHVLEMQGRAEDGRVWLSQPTDAWDDRNPFKGHVWWHTAMFHLALGDHDNVLELYDNTVVPDPSEFYLDVQNAASMLARLDMLGVDVGDRWSVIADIAESKCDDHVLAFTEMHNMMALAREGRTDAAARQLESMRKFAETPHNYAAATMNRVAIPLCDAILAHGKGDHARAVELMLPIRYDYACTGGSHAQRDVFSQYLIDSARKSNQPKLARNLLAERVELFPSNRTAWTLYAETLEGLGDREAAARARAVA